MGSFRAMDPMKLASRGGDPLIERETRSETSSSENEPEARRPMDPMRSWLVSGIHLFVVDPRRRFGGHGHSKELLVIGDREGQGASDHLHRLAAALQRHTLRGGLERLNPEERRLITLAYLEGRTNRQIATVMGVSVSTVRRRLGAALERLDAYISRSGAWLSALVVLAASYATVHAARLGRSAAGFVGPAERAQKLAATLTAGAMTMAAIGMLGVTSDSATPEKSAPTATSPFVVPTIASTQQVGSGPDRPQAVVPAQDPTFAVKTRGDSADPVATVAAPPPTDAHHSNNGCGGNPTSAPPPVPVGSADSHPSGAPVTHPTAGGCRA
jgi:RNA polymerase sigma factor (sigma-70 family)